MAFIQKLQLRGIRSFSPENDETIEFYSPLTVIVGMNGCGKTTIIEALKYACCGSLPPGTRSGQAFINDPSMTDSSDVKAHIKLKFKNRRGFASVAVRLLQLTRKSSKLEFKALDAVLQTIDENGKSVSNSMKCSELDKQIPDLVGVSSAVMENVIFCHQEESDWPMQDGAMVKKKFDDIFDSARYSKALEAIMKAKKEKVLNAKDLKAEVGELGAHLVTVKQLHRDREACTESQTASRDQLLMIDEKIERFDERIQISKEYVRKYQQVTTEMDTLRIRITESERRVLEKSSSIKKLLTVSDYELQRMLQNFEVEMNEKLRDQVDIQQQIDQANDEIRKLRLQLDEIGIEEGKAIAAKNQLQELKESAVNFMNSSALELSIPQPRSHIWSEILVKDFLQSVVVKMDRMNQESDDLIRKTSRAVGDQEKKLADERGIRKALELEIQSIHKDLSRLSDERINKQRELTALGFSKSEYQIALDEYEEAKNKTAAFDGSVMMKVNELKKNQKEKLDEIKSIEEEIEQNDLVLQNLTMLRSEKAAIIAEERRMNEDYESFQSDMKSLYQSYQYRDLLLPFQAFFDKFFLRSTAASENSDLSPGFHDLLSNLRQKQTVFITEYEMMVNKDNQTQQELSKYQGLLAQETATMKSFRQRESMMISKEQTLVRLIQDVNMLNQRYKYTYFTAEEYSRELSSDMSVTSVNTILDRIKVMTNDIREYILLLNAETILKSKFERKRRELGSDKCPCCHQGMSQDVLKIYEKSINELLVPSNAAVASGGSALATSEAEAKSVEAQCKDIYNSVISLSSDLTELQLLRNDIKSSEKKINDFQYEIKQVELNVANIRDQIQPLKQRNEACDHCMKEMSLLQGRYESYDKKRIEIETKKRKSTMNAYSGFGEDPLKGKSIEEFELYCRDRRNSKDELFHLKEKYRNDEDKLLQQQQTYRNIVMDRERNVTMMKTKFERYNDLEESIRSLNQRYDALDQSLRQKQGSSGSSMSSNSFSTMSNTSNNDPIIQEIESQLFQLKSELKSHEESKQKQSLQCENIISTINKQCTQIQQLESRFQQEYSQYATNSSDMMTTSSKRRENITTNIDYHQNLIQNKLQSKLSSIQHDLSSQEEYKRNVHDNIALRSSQQECEVLRQDLDKLQYELSLPIAGQNETVGMNSNQKYKDMQRELQRLEQEKTRYQSEKDMLRGKLENYSEQLIELDNKLNSTLYRNIEEKYRRKAIEYETTEMVVKDLDSYYTALDNALQNFHVQKIKEINKIIRELWQVVYKGQDIDMIEIESGPESSTGLATSARSGSRSYNYRVVMRKGDTPLDMRGRCSAGQRILASIVIRLALAETFCLNCGILALDEPTTNLDDANKIGLASCLATLIQSRSNQQNFQLICITHDEDFVSILNAELSANLDFRKPNFYFRIRREEKDDSGKFFSHIQRIPWEDM